MAALSVIRVRRDSLASVTTIALGGTNTFENNGQTFLYLNNADASDCVVTAKITGLVDNESPSGKAVTIGGGTVAAFGPFPTNAYSNNVTFYVGNTAAITGAALSLL
jgi:hypothetical protein